MILTCVGCVCSARLGKEDTSSEAGRPASGKSASGLGYTVICGATIKEQVKAQLLTEAVNTFVSHGDLREELLPLLWEPVSTPTSCVHSLAICQRSHHCIMFVNGVARPRLDYMKMTTARSC